MTRISRGPSLLTMTRSYKGRKLSLLLLLSAWTIALIRWSQRSNTREGFNIKSNAAFYSLKEKTALRLM